MLERLADETYLDVHGETRESIAKALVPTFERMDKRNKDVTRRPTGSLKVPGLRGDVRRGLTGSKAKRFEDNRLLLDWCVILFTFIFLHAKHPRQARL